MGKITKRKEIIDHLGIWIKRLEYEENDSRTDAELRFVVTGMRESPICGDIDRGVLTYGMVLELAESVAGRFCDTHVVEEMSCTFSGTRHDNAVDDWVLEVDAAVHLAEADDDPYERFDGLDKVVTDGEVNFSVYE